MPADWLNTVPEDLRGEAMLQNIPDVGTLAKSYVHSQRLIGQSRLPAPDANWKPEQWNEFYNKIGRPEKPDGYKLPDDVKLADGLQFDDAKKAAAFEALHKAGLTATQAAEVMRYYVGTMNSAYTAESEAKKTALASGIEELKRQHGDKYEAVIGVAKQALSQLGDEKFVQFLESSGLANNPQMVNFLHKIGVGMAEDRQRSGSGTTGVFTGDAGAASLELQRLEKDTDFQKAYRDRYHPEHQAAIDRVLNLNRIIYPGKQAD